MPFHSGECGVKVRDFVVSLPRNLVKESNHGTFEELDPAVSYSFCLQPSTCPRQGARFLARPYGSSESKLAYARFMGPAQRVSGDQGGHAFFRNSGRVAKVSAAVRPVPDEHIGLVSAIVSPVGAMGNHSLPWETTLEVLLESWERFTSTKEVSTL